MKLLKSVRLVHFYAFDQLDAEIGNIMGIFGPNGSGKSSLLDAIQIAMTGADENRQNLNAQANDGKRSKRNIHSYCLGTLGENRRARDEALSYITLVWEDENTGEIVSNGVCISCSADMDRHKVEARYVVQGIDIPLEEHLLTINGKVHPRPAKDFKRMLQERGAQVCDDPVLFDSATQYVRSLLFALRPSSGTINQESFLRSFVFALAMSFDKSVDEIVRKEVLEKRPLDIAKFMAVTESFRKLQQLVIQTEEKLAEAEKVQKAFDALADVKSRLASWRSLACEASLEIASEATNKVQSELSEAEEKLDELTEEKGCLKHKVDEAQQRYADHIDAMRSNESLQRRTQLEQKSEDIKARKNKLAELVNESIKRLAQGLDQCTSAVDDCTDLDNTALCQSLATINPLQLDAFSRPIEETTNQLTAAGHVLRQSLQSLRKCHWTVDQQVSTLDGVLKDLQSNRNRALAGKTSLDPAVTSLRQALEDEGISSTPVCDLVEITDPSWQIVIESYLRPHLQTLLIDNPKQETVAFALARKRAAYGVKLLLGSREKLGREYDKGTVASLIEGKSQTAIAYLRRQFGDMRCAESNQEALGSTHTLTRDGMLVSNSTCERLKLVESHQLKIGMRDRTEQLAQLDRQERETKHQLQEAKLQKLRLGELIAALGWAEPHDWAESVGVCLEEHAQLIGTLQELTHQIGQLNTSESNTLEQQKQELHELVQSAQSDLDECHKKIGNIEGLCDRLTTDIEKAKQYEGKCRDIFKQVDADPLIDASWREKQWERFYQKYKTDYSAILAECQTKKSEAEDKEQRDAPIAQRLLGQYLERFSENGALDKPNWPEQRDWITTVVVDLRDSKLIDYRQQLEEAYHTSQVTFRNDVALAIKQRLDDMSRHLDQLNGALLRCPVFSNGERYRFKRTLRPEHRPLYDFITRIDLYGAQEDLLGGAGEIPEAFRQLLNARSQPGAAGQATPLDDYREFFDFDIEILLEDAESGRRDVVGLLSRRVGSGSGGEHRAPLYVIAGAALANAYHLDRQRDGMGLIMLDEAFARMDLTNIVATMRYFEDLGLQVLLASPGENMGILDAFMDRYYAIARDGFQVEFEGHDVSEATRLKFREDLPAYLMAEADEEEHDAQDEVVA